MPGPGPEPIAVWCSDVDGDPLTLRVTDDADAAFARCREILAFGGEGHTLGLHAQDAGVIEWFSGLPVSRVIVNTPTLFGGMGYSAALDPKFDPDGTSRYVRNGVGIGPRGAPIFVISESSVSFPLT